MHIVTGGAGFIGSAMVWKLNNMGIDNILVVDNLSTSEKWKNLVSLRYAEYMHRDAFFDAIKNKTFKGSVKAVIHMGACSATTEKNADFLMHNNLEYSKAVCRFALDKGGAFINASSASTYGDGSLGFSDYTNLNTLRPLNMYGYSKLLFDVWAQKQNLFESISSLKFFNVYGPNENHKGDMQSVVQKSFHTIMHEGKVQLFRSTHPDYKDGCQMRDFVYVKDCVRIMGWLLQNPNVAGIFNVGTGTARTWVDLVTAVFTALNKPVHIEFIDMPKNLAGKYQNFTQSTMEHLKSEGYTTPMTTLEKGVQDYVVNYLATPYPYLQ